jgi:hypothetical protein
MNHQSRSCASLLSCLPPSSLPISTTESPHPTTITFSPPPPTYTYLLCSNYIIYVKKNHLLASVLKNRSLAGQREHDGHDRPHAVLGLGEDERAGGVEHLFMCVCGVVCVCVWCVSCVVWCVCVSYACVSARACECVGVSVFFWGGGRGFDEQYNKTDRTGYGGRGKFSLVDIVHSFT